MNETFNKNCDISFYHDRKNEQKSSMVFDIPPQIIVIVVPYIWHLCKHSMQCIYIYKYWMNTFWSKSCSKHVVSLSLSFKQQTVKISILYFIHTNDATSVQQPISGSFCNKGNESNDSNGTWKMFVNLLNAQSNLHCRCQCNRNE